VLKRSDPRPQTVAPVIKAAPGLRVHAAYRRAA
jgi:hypothetical protein